MNTILQGQIKGADKELSNLSNRQRALRNIGGRPNRNLLDNWYFMGGGSQQGGGQFPINQRGETSYTAAGSQPIFDRWKSNNATVFLNADDITVTGNYNYGNMTQLIENWDSFAGKTVTLSALITGGDGVGSGAYIDILDGVTEYVMPIASVGLIYETVTLPDNITKLELGIVSSNVTGKTLSCKATKLELGSTQTLAYQDESGNWQLFETPDYAEELAKCKRYYCKSAIDVNQPFGGDISFAQGTEWLNCAVKFPVEMRIIPTIHIDWISLCSNITVNLLTGSVSANATGADKTGFNTIHISGLSLQADNRYNIKYTASAEL